MKNKTYQDINRQIRLMSDGFLWEIIQDSSSAFELMGSCYQLNDDGSESLLEKEEDFDRNNTYGIEIGFISNDIAKSILKTNGKYTDNLWSIGDVMDKYQVTEEEAQYILDKALTNEATMEQIWFSIDQFAEMEGLEPQEIEEE